MQRRWGIFTSFSRRRYVGLCLPFLGLCLLPGVLGIISRGTQWEQANKRRECVLSTAVMMEVKYWWPNFKWEFHVIIRGLKLKGRLWQPTQFFYGDWFWRTENPCEGQESSAVLTADTEADNFMKAYGGHTLIGGLKRKGERREWCKYDNYSCTSKRENHPKM